MFSELKEMFLTEIGKGGKTGIICIKQENEQQQFKYGITGMCVSNPIKI